ncbi:MAG: glycosyltransferase [Paracoccaceae bacterium]
MTPRTGQYIIMPGKRNGVLSNDTNIFGYMRFSYLGRSDVKLAQRDLDTRIQTLYSEDRMNERFYLFEKICLPSLRWQSDQDFRFAIFSSPEMPDPFKQRLANAVADIPQVEIIYETASHITYAIHPWMERQPIIQQHRTAHFRLDDDDALSSDFIATIRSHMQGVPNRCIISMPNGLFLVHADKGPELLAKFEAHIAIGFTLVNDPGVIHNPYALRHGAHYQNVPSLMLPEPMGYIHTAHNFSDTIRAQQRKIQNAREAHESRFGNKPRRFKMAVARHFGGHKPPHFHKIIAEVPSSRTVGQKAAATAPA